MINILNAEKAVLHHILYINGKDSFINQLEPQDFNNHLNRKIFETILYLKSCGYQDIDVLTIRGFILNDSTLRLLFPNIDEYMMDLSFELDYDTINQIEILKEASLKRKLSRYLIEWKEKINTDASFTDIIQKMTVDIQSCQKSNSKIKYVNLYDVVKEIEEDLKNSAPGVPGLSTGITSLDQVLLGIKGGEFIIVGAKTGGGKSIFAVHMALDVAIMQNLPVVYFNYEMSNKDIAGRMLSNLTDINSRLFRMNDKTINIEKINQSAELIKNKNLFIIDERNLDYIGIENYIVNIEAKINRKICLVIIDYIQLVRPVTKFDSKEREVSEVSTALRTLAGRREIPVIALAQLNRNSEGRSANDRKPRIGDIRDSARLEQDASSVIFIHREDITSNFAEIIVAKNRNGMSDITLQVEFKPEYSRIGKENNYLTDYEEKGYYKLENCGKNFNDRWGIK